MEWGCPRQVRSIWPIEAGVLSGSFSTITRELSWDDSQCLPGPLLLRPLKVPLIRRGGRAVAAGIGDHRRGKTVFFLAACGWAGAMPHWLDPSRSLIPAFTLAMLLGGYALRTLMRGPDQQTTQNNGSESNDSPSMSVEVFPTVDVVVAARDEEAVVNLYTTPSPRDPT